MFVLVSYSFPKYKLHFLQHPVSVYLVEWITHYTIMSYIVCRIPVKAVSNLDKSQQNKFKEAW